MFKVLTKGCEPTKGSKYSAGIDLYASEDVIIGAGETAIVGLGVAIDVNFFLYKVGKMDIACNGEILRAADSVAIDYFFKRHYLELHPRSSLRAKGLISNTGIIDLDYKDEIKIIIHNPIGALQFFQDYTDQSREDYKIKKGDKIAQILLKEHKSYLLGVESDEERVGGFGSTGE